MAVRVRPSGCLSKTTLSSVCANLGLGRCWRCAATVTVVRLTIHFGFEHQRAAAILRKDLALGFSVSEVSANLVYACEQWEIDLGRRELRSRGIPVPLGGRAFEIVTALVQSPHRAR